MHNYCVSNLNIGEIELAVVVMYIGEVMCLVFFTRVDYQLMSSFKLISYQLPPNLRLNH